jgi:hypothetical protein
MDKDTSLFFRLRHYLFNFQSITIFSYIFFELNASIFSLPLFAQNPPPAELAEAENGRIREYDQSGRLHGGIGIHYDDPQRHHGGMGIHETQPARHHGGMGIHYHGDLTDPRYSYPQFLQFPHPHRIYYNTPLQESENETEEMPQEPNSRLFYYDPNYYYFIKR